MNNLNLRISSYTLLHDAVITHLHRKPETYSRLWEFYSDSHGTLFHLLQSMLDEGEITANNLKNGLITDDSLIALARKPAVETKARAKPLLPHSPWLHTRLA